jgi:hypothetical protein
MTHPLVSSIMRVADLDGVLSYAYGYDKPRYVRRRTSETTRRSPRRPPRQPRASSWQAAAMGLSLPEGYRIERDAEVAPAGFHGEGATGLPKFDYHLDESDPDVAVLRRQDSSFVAALAQEGQRGRASWRPQKRTTRSWSKRSRSAWTPRKTMPKLGSELLRTP